MIKDKYENFDEWRLPWRWQPLIAATRLGTKSSQEPHLCRTILPHWCTLVQEPHWCHTCTTQECTLVQEPHSPQKLVSPALLTSHNIVLTHAKKPNIMTKIVFLVETVFKTPINVKILQLPSSRDCICHTLNFYLWGHAESFRVWPRGEHLKLGFCPLPVCWAFI